MNAAIQQLAIKKATQSYCRFRVSAIALDKNGKVLATAVNRPRLDKLGGGSHAEIEVLRKAGRRIKTIIICRIGNTGLLRAIHCCENCLRVLNKLGIRVYSIVPI
jgi:tRNA(Arg) A34 adenosine deaminase TadA